MAIFNKDIFGEIIKIKNFKEQFDIDFNNLEEMENKWKTL